MNTKKLSKFHKLKLNKNKEINRLALKTISIAFNVPKQTKIYSTYLQKKTESTPKRCVISGQSKSLYNKWSINRHVLRKLISKKFIFGLKKASW